MRKNIHQMTIKPQIENPFSHNVYKNVRNSDISDRAFIIL